MWTVTEVNTGCRVMARHNKIFSAWLPRKVYIQTSPLSKCTGSTKLRSTLNIKRQMWCILMVSSTTRIMGSLRNKIIISPTCMMAREERKWISSNSQTRFSSASKRDKTSLNRISKDFSRKTLQTVLDRVANILQDSISKDRKARIFPHRLRFSQVITKLPTRMVAICFKRRASHTIKSTTTKCSPCLPITTNRWHLHLKKDTCSLDDIKHPQRRWRPQR